MEHAEDHPSRIQRRNAVRKYSFRDVGMYCAMRLMKAPAAAVATGDAGVLHDAAIPQITDHPPRNTRSRTIFGILGKAAITRSLSRPDCWGALKRKGRVTKAASA